MNRLLFSLLLLANLPVLCFADDPGRIEGTVKVYDDYVKIRFIPSQADHLKGAATTELKRSALTIIAIQDGKVMQTNTDIQDIYARAKALADKGITSNQQIFHVSLKKIEISYRGKTVKLAFSSKSDLQKYRQYEQDWLALYQDVYQYLTNDIRP